MAFTEQLPALDLAEIPVVPDRPRIVHQYRILFILQKILEIPVRRHFPVLHIPLFHFQYGGNPGIFRNRLLPALHRCLPAETVADYYLYIAIAFLFHAGAIFLIIVPFLFNWKIRPLSIFVVCGAGVAVLYFFLNTSFANTYMFLNNIEEQGRAYISIKSNINGYIAPLLFRILFPAIIYYIGIKRGLNKDKLAPLFFFILSVSILTTIFPQLYRLFNYLRLLEVVLCANVLYLIQHTESPRYRVAFPNLYILPILLLIIANQVVRYQFDDTSSIYMNTQKYQLFYPYYSVFNPEISETREMMMRNQFYHNEY